MCNFTHLQISKLCPEGSYFNRYKRVWIQGYYRTHLLYNIITLCEGVMDDKLFGGNSVSDVVFLQGH